MKLNLLIILNILKEDIIEAIRFGLVVRGLSSIHKVRGPILIGNIVNQQKKSNESTTLPLLA
jgi:hypothetical protein